MQQGFGAQPESMCMEDTASKAHGRSITTNNPASVGMCVSSYQAVSHWQHHTKLLGQLGHPVAQDQHDSKSAQATHTALGQCTRPVASVAASCVLRYIVPLLFDATTGIATRAAACPALLTPCPCRFAVFRCAPQYGLALFQRLSPFKVILQHTYSWQSRKCS